MFSSVIQWIIKRECWSLENIAKNKTSNFAFISSYSNSKNLISSSNYSSRKQVQCTRNTQKPRFQSIIPDAKFNSKNLKNDMEVMFGHTLAEIKIIARAETQKSWADHYLVPYLHIVVSSLKLKGVKSLKLTLSNLKFFVSFF